VGGYIATTRVRAAAAIVLAMIAVACPRIAHADGALAPAAPADVADHLRLTGFAFGEIPIDLGIARAPRLYIWDPISREQALPVTGPDLASALFVLHVDW
jgi:hypothetical protein